KFRDSPRFPAAPLAVTVGIDGVAQRSAIHRALRAPLDPLDEHIVFPDADFVTVQAAGFAVQAGEFAVQAEGFAVQAEGVTVQAEGFAVQAEGFTVQAEGFTAFTPPRAAAPHAAREWAASLGHLGFSRPPSILTELAQLHWL